MVSWVKAQGTFFIVYIAAGYISDKREAYGNHVFGAAAPVAPVMACAAMSVGDFHITDGMAPERGSSDFFKLSFRGAARNDPCLQVNHQVDMVGFTIAALNQLDMPVLETRIWC